MELRDMIDIGINKVGSRNALADRIGVAGQQITDAKSGRVKLPDIACGKLGEILGIDRWTVVAASNLVTEKNPEKRAYLAQFLRHAAVVVMTIALSFVTFIATAPRAEAAPILKYDIGTMYIMLNIEW
ncbi:MAG: hypothetical protein Q7U97_12040 [Rhodocyclaceae bacterium]|nr:hypothetical protein [Rhodocyclaceae bacterium]